MKRTSFSILCIMSCLSLFAQQENAITEATENLKLIINYTFLVAIVLFAIIILIAFYKRKKSKI